MDWTSIEWTRWLFNFAFFYPIVMAFFWMTGGVYYYLRVVVYMYMRPAAEGETAAADAETAEA